MAHHHRLIEAVCLGGLASVVAVDFSELVFYCIDPAVKKCLKLVEPPASVGGAQVVVAPPETMGLSPATVAPQTDEEKRAQKEKDAKRGRRQVVKRLVRILLLLSAIYALIWLISKK